MYLSPALLLINAVHKYEEKHSNWYVHINNTSLETVKIGSLGLMSLYIEKVHSKNHSSISH